MSTALPYPPPAKAKAATPDPAPSGVTLTAQQLADETAATIERATRVLAVAARLVTDYAPQAPTEALNEAVVRFGGYLVQSDYGTVRDEALGPQSVSYTTNHAALFRTSGAMALLTRYKRRRAGAV